MYCRYYLTAANGRGHGTHSPFVFEFITKVMNDPAVYADYTDIETIRKRMLADETLLDVEDFGAGSVKSSGNQRTIRSIAKTAAKPKKFGQLLYRMVKYYRPRTIIELGTSLGLTTSYLAKANPGSRVITMEGSKPVLDIAKRNFGDLGLDNIETIEGNFDDKLSGVIESFTSSIDLAFIDGNHRLAPTLHYFESILTRSGNDSIIILDDIHWSADMEQAWRHCKAHSSVTLSIDLFFIGILVFRKEIKEKQHFVIRF